jgi:exodeoxyribonuclease-3
VGRETAISAVIRACEPDVVVLQEATRPEVVESIGRKCGMQRWGALRGNSLAFLSRTAVEHHAWHRTPFARRRYLEVLPGGSGLRIFGVHLSAVHSNLTERRRAFELGRLLDGIERHQNGFHIVVGDFNTLAPGEELDLRRLPFRLRAFVWLTGRKIRWITIQQMLDAGYVDAYRRFERSDEGFTFPTWDPHVRLDYAFVPAEFATRIRSCTIVRDVAGVRDASDHFPLLVELE